MEAVEKRRNRKSQEHRSKKAMKHDETKRLSSICRSSHNTSSASLELDPRATRTRSSGKCHVQCDIQQGLAEMRKCAYDMVYCLDKMTRLVRGHQAKWPPR